MPKITNAVRAASETYLLALIEKGSAGKLKLAEAQSAAALLDACKAYGELTEREESIAVARDLIAKAEEVRAEGQEQATRAASHFATIRTELGSLRGEIAKVQKRSTGAKNPLEPRASLRQKKRER